MCLCIISGAGVDQAESEAAVKQSECDWSETQPGSRGHSEIQVTVAEGSVWCQGNMKLYTTVHKCLHSQAPDYLSELYPSRWMTAPLFVQSLPTCRVTDSAGHVQTSCFCLVRQFGTLRFQTSTSPALFAYLDESFSAVFSAMSA